MKRSRAVATIAAIPALLPFAARAQGNAPYKIGVTYPLTGPLAAIAGELLEGAKLAVAEINAAGGVKGHPILLVIEDTAGTPQGGVAAFRKVVQVDAVQAIMNIYTNVVTAQIPLADELKIPALSTVESPGLFAKSEYSFSHAPTWGITLPLMTAYWKAHNIKRVYGLLTNSAIGQLQTARLKASVAEIGGEYGDALLDPAQTDYRGAVARARDAGAEVIMITGQGSTTDSNTVKQIKEMGLKSEIWSFGQSYTSKSFHDAVGPYAEGMVFGGLYLDPNVSNKFARAYRDRVGYIPAYNAGENYDIIKMYAYAFGKVGYNAEAIRNTIATLKGVPSVLGGTITMGTDHYTEFSFAGLWRVKTGKLVRISGKSGTGTT
jgi:branched-chain amino acid transport system substrate-binding protein